MNCPQCNAPTKPGQKFCAVCGARLVPPVETTQEPLVAAPMTAPQPPPQAPAFVPRAYEQPAPGPVSSLPQPVVAPAPRRQDSRRLVIAGIVVLALLVIPAVLVMLALFGQRSDTPGVVVGRATATTTTISPTLTLDRAVEAMEQVGTLRYDGSVAFFGVEQTEAVTSTQGLTISIKGDMRLPDSYTFNSNVTQLGNYIVMGDQAWGRREETDPWEPRAPEEIRLGLANPLTLLQYIRYYEGDTATVVGSETENGVLLHRIHFDVDGEIMAADMQETSVRGILATSDTRVDVWVRDTDHLIERIIVNVEQPSGAGVVIRATLSDHGGEVDIKPPE